MHDCIIIGAGIAGLAAAQTLADAGIHALVVEARDRIGGRIYTDHTHGPAELGAEFIHGEYAVTWEIIRAAQLRTIDWSGQRRFAVNGRLRPVDDPLGSQVARLYSAAAGYTGSELAATELLAKLAAPADPAHTLALRWLANIEGADPHKLDAAALSRERAASSNGDTNYHLLDGYDAVPAHLAASLNIRLNSPVEQIVWDAAAVQVVVTGGATLAARHVIITVPLGVLQAGRITFAPALPPAKQAAIDSIAMGNVTKLLLWFARPIWPEELGLISSDGQVSTWWPIESAAVPAVMGYTGGLYGLDLARYGETEAIAIGLRELSQLLDVDAAAACIGGKLADWSRDPWSLGAYTYSPLGMGNARAALAAPLGRLHFAGEATVLGGHIATVHGAIESGRRAAGEIMLNAEC
ncbi:MAG: FAD-dependent oxidoreductase [Oscillochloris sp.]|nr:FAD-dependent oxidoreductase [Oscillochloris sp.]